MRLCRISVRLAFHCKVDRFAQKPQLRLAGVFLTKHEMSALSKVYDPSGQDHVDYQRFVGDLNHGLNTRRQALVDKAFAKFTETSPAQPAAAAEYVPASKPQFLACFDSSAAPDVKAGRVDAERILRHFDSQLSDAFGHAEWSDVMSDFGAAIPSDEYFANFVENCFNVMETEADAVSDMQNAN